MSLTSELKNKNLKVSYKVAESIINEDERYSQSSLKIYRADPKRPLATFYFQTQRLPYCCGIYELGSFRIDQSRNVSHILMQLALKTLITKTIKVLGSERLFMANLIDNQACTTIEAPLRDLNFTVVKEFTNPGSGNIIRVFMNS